MDVSYYEFDSEVWTRLLGQAAKEILAGYLIEGGRLGALAVGIAAAWDVTNPEVDAFLSAYSF